MTYFGDLECPVCQHFTLNGGFPQLVANEVRQGKVKVVYRAFETATQTPRPSRPSRWRRSPPAGRTISGTSPSSSTASRARRARGYVTESYLSGLAAQVPGLNMSAVAGRPR